MTIKSDSQSPQRERIVEAATFFLKNFFDDPARVKGTPTFYTFQGIAFALACAPMILKLKDLMSMAFCHKDPRVDGDAQSQNLNKNFIEYFDTVVAGVNRNKPVLPPGYALAANNPFEVFQDNHPLSQWAQGFREGFEMTRQYWPRNGEADYDDRIISCYNVLGFFSDPEFADRVFAQIEPDAKRRRPENLRIYAEAIYREFGASMISFTEIARHIYEIRLRSGGFDVLGSSSAAAGNAEDDFKPPVYRLVKNPNQKTPIAEFIYKPDPLAEAEFSKISSLIENNEPPVETLQQMIEDFPDFFDPYFYFYEYLINNDYIIESFVILEDAYDRICLMISDSRGNFPLRLEWAAPENRTLIRLLDNWAEVLWEVGEVPGTLEIYRKLLRSDPADHIGARYKILAIRLNLGFDYENELLKNGEFVNNPDIAAWFARRKGEFPEEWEGLDV